MSRTALVALVLSALVVGAGGYLVREATISRDREMHPDSTVTVVVDSRSNRAEPTRTLREMTAAQLAFCRLEVESDPVGPLEPVEGHTGRFRQTLRPAFDTTDVRQFTGCVEDWVLDHHLVSVVSVTTEPPEGTGGGVRP